MSSADHLRRFTIDQTAIRGELVQLSSSYAKTIESHDYPDAVKRLLGEFLAASALLSATIKFEGSLILQLKSEGQVSMMMAECRNQTFLRAVASYADSYDTEKPLFEQGQLAIAIEPEKGQRYQGIVSLDEPNLSAALEGYFMQSEQLPTRIWLAANDNNAAGLLLQALPESADESSLSAKSEDWQRLEMLSDTITNEELLDLQPETILFRLYHEEEVRIYPVSELEFNCSCSRERGANSLLSIGEIETRKALIESDGEILIDCQFCNARYPFTEQDVNLLFETRVH